MANQNGKQKAYEPGTLALFAGLGIFMSILGVVSLLAVVGGVQGMAFEKIKQVMQGLGGSLCIGISVLLIWGGALCMFTAGKNVPKRSYFAMLALFLCVLGIFNLLSSVGSQNLMEYGVQYNQTQYSPPLSHADGYWNLIRFGYRVSSGSGVFGGALGMLLAWPAWMFLGAGGSTGAGAVRSAAVAGAAAGRRGAEQPELSGVSPAAQTPEGGTAERSAPGTAPAGVSAAADGGPADRPPRLYADVCPERPALLRAGESPAVAAAAAAAAPAAGNVQ